MRECDAFVLVATPERVNSTWAPFEFGAARALGMPIFVVLTEQGPLPGYLRDFSTGSVKDVDRLVRAIRAATDTSGSDGMRVERDLFLDLFGTDDQREGMRAFLEKRSPRFGGRWDEDVSPKNS